MQFPIIIGLHRSRFLDLIVPGVAVVAGLAVLAWPQPLVLRFAIAGAIAVAAYWVRGALAPRFSAIRLERTGNIGVLPVGGDAFIPATLLPQAVVHAWLTVARLRTADGKIHPLLVAADSTDPQAFRKLRVFLRWLADFSQPDGAA